MARPQSVDDARVLEQLGCVFREVGYEGASLAQLSKATGLKKASLYHRFPGGKQQMAEEVLAQALRWYEEHVFAPLKGSGTPRARLATVTANLNAFYGGGAQACLLNMLAAPRSIESPFSPAIKGAHEAVAQAFARLAREAGHSAAAARTRAERAIMLLHGSLVLSRGLASPEPFKAFLKSLPHELLGDDR